MITTIICIQSSSRSAADTSTISIHDVCIRFSFYVSPSLSLNSVGTNAVSAGNRQRCLMLAWRAGGGGAISAVVIFLWENIVFTFYMPIFPDASCVPPPPASPLHCFIFCLFYYRNDVGGGGNRALLHSVIVNCNSTNVARALFACGNVYCITVGRYEWYAHMQTHIVHRMKFHLIFTHKSRLASHKNNNPRKTQKIKLRANNGHVHPLASAGTLDEVNVFLMFYDCIFVTFCSCVWVLCCVRLFPPYLSSSRGAVAAQPFFLHSSVSAHIVSAFHSIASLRMFIFPFGLWIRCHRRRCRFSLSSPHSSHIIHNSDSIEFVHANF